MATFQISITDECDGNCPFCISKMTYRVNHSKFNWDNLDDAIFYAQQKGIQVAKITGKWGEPLLVPERITGVLSHLGGFETIELQTNAKRTYFDRTQWAMWKKLGLNLVSVSCVHWDYDKNKLIYGGRQEPKEILETLKGYGYKVRLNCLLMTGWIDTPKKIKEFIDKFPEADQISFIPIGASEKYSTAVGAIAYKWAREHIISTKKYQEIIDYLNNTYERIDKTSYSSIFEDGIYIADCLAIPPVEDEYRHLIYFPDGTLRYSWEDENSIINIK